MSRMSTHLQLPVTAEWQEHAVATRELQQRFTLEESLSESQGGGGRGMRPKEAGGLNPPIHGVSSTCVYYITMYIYIFKYIEYL